MGDPGHFYTSTYLNDTWVEESMAHVGGMSGLNCWKSKIDKWETFFSYHNMKQPIISLQGNKERLGLLGRYQEVSSMNVIK